MSVRHSSATQADDSRPEPTPASEPEPPTPTPTPAPEFSPPSPASPPASHQADHQQQAEAERQTRLLLQNLQLIVAKVDQMASAHEEAARAQSLALQDVKAATELLTDFLANLDEKIARIETVAAALIRFSQEQAARSRQGI